jgi:dihydropteroate synthase
MHQGRTLVMGVLNVTPDSFSDGGNFFSTDAALTQARRLIADGADILDIGAESTRPGSDPVSEQEELDRVAPVIEKVANEFATPISIDTCKPAVADQCCQIGATIVNDITGLTDVNMLRAVKQHKAAVVIMHMRGKPKTMQQDVDYVDVVVAVREFLAQRVAVAKKAGIEEIVIDPGIGFGKTVEHNLTLLSSLDELRALGLPVLVGISRKRSLGALTGRAVEDRLAAGLGAAVAAAANGAAIIRTHDVAATVDALAVAQAIWDAKDNTHTRTP